MTARSWLLGCIAALAFACGSNGSGNIDANGGGGDGDGGVDGDGGIGTVDAPPFGGECSPTSTYECSDCMDNDGDTRIDGFDPECSGARDDREDSFATGIPGDNIDATQQDCFFDGNSGGGNDGCNQHVCCLLQADDQQECATLAPNANSNQYNKAQCYQPFGSTPVPSKCTMVCAPLTPPGCDCFGCCTVCNDQGCADIILNPAVSPMCDQSNVTSLGNDGVDNTGDEPCKRCVKNTECGSPECGGATCILCPGQDPSTLPGSCTGSVCPQGITACNGDGSCNEAGTYCNNGCCVGTIF